MVWELMFLFCCFHKIMFLIMGSELKSIWTIYISYIYYFIKITIINLSSKQILIFNYFPDSTHSKCGLSLLAFSLSVVDLHWVLTIPLQCTCISVYWPVFLSLSFQITLSFVKMLYSLQYDRDTYTLNTFFQHYNLLVSENIVRFCASQLGTVYQTICTTKTCCTRHHI